MSSNWSHHKLWSDVIDTDFRACACHVHKSSPSWITHDTNPSYRKFKLVHITYIRRLAPLVDIPPKLIWFRTISSFLFDNAPRHETETENGRKEMENKRHRERNVYLSFLIARVPHSIDIYKAVSKWNPVIKWGLIRINRSARIYTTCTCD